MQRLKITNDTIFRKIKMRAYFGHLHQTNAKKFNLKHVFLCIRVIRKR